MRFTFNAMSVQVCSHPCGGKNKFVKKKGWIFGWRKNTLLKTLVRVLA